MNNFFDFENEDPYLDLIKDDSYEINSMLFKND